MDPTARLVQPVALHSLWLDRHLVVISIQQAEAQALLIKLPVLVTATEALVLANRLHPTVAAPRLIRKAQLLQAVATRRLVQTAQRHTRLAARTQLVVAGVRLRATQLSFLD